MAKRRSTEELQLHIINSIDTLMYQKGFNTMSFSDIALASGVTKGNLYYYFKTKEDILQAVIDHRINAMKQMLAQWDEEFPSPLQRLKRFAQIPLNEADNVIQYGCPMGSLNIELAKAQPDLQKISKRQFSVFKTWLKKQMKLMLPNKDSEELTMQLLIRSQGIAVISQIYKDKKLISREVKNIQLWLDNLTT